MKAFAAVNLTERSMSACNPPDFKPETTIPAQVRGDKVSRQQWYQSADTKHNFYTLVEPANPNIRASKDNPPKYLHGVVADYDLPIPEARLLEAIAGMKLKPEFIERSLGGNARLVWTFSRPLLLDEPDFCYSIFQELSKWLNLGLLPGLDEGAVTDPNRLYCNGGEWKATGHGKIDEVPLQSFFVRIGAKHKFVGDSEAAGIPLSIVEKGLQAAFPGFAWPATFEPESQGPSFWIPESTSPQSAILKPDGFFTFSAHATKPFYSWSDILGREFVAKYVAESIAAATANLYWDSKRFWRLKGGYYASLDMTELQNFFKVNCSLSSKPGADGQSAVDRALNHIYNYGHVTGAAPFLFRPSGLMEFMGKRVLNTYLNRVMKPAESAGNFDWVRTHLNSLFDPESQLDHFLAWLKHFYESALNEKPRPGQNVYFMGGADVGKTMTSRAIIGRVVGGYADASDFLVHGSSFNSQLFEAPLWCVDDESAGGSASKEANFFAVMKKTAANQQFTHKKKFEVECMTEWAGRVVVTTNLDYVSSRMLGPMDNTSLDKTNIFRCPLESKLHFPDRYEIIAILDRELPFFLRWLLDWSPPANVKRHVRYGYAAFHEPSLLEQSHQSSRIAPFKEILIETLAEHFAHHPADQEVRGTVGQILRLVMMNPLNDFILRSSKVEQVNRYLEQIQREGLVSCRVETDELKNRIWIFNRFGVKSSTPQVAPPVNPQVVNIFSK